MIKISDNKIQTNVLILSNKFRIQKIIFLYKLTHNILVLLKRMTIIRKICIIF